MSTELLAVRPDRELTDGETALLFRLLPPERRERLLRQHRAEQRREPLCAYGLLLLALRRRLGWRMLPPVDRGPGGKPFFPDFPAVHWNLSTRRAAVLAGVSDRPLGVDIEHFRPVTPRLLRRLEADSAEEALGRWVRLEALAKQSGTGVLTALDRMPTAGETASVHDLAVFPGCAAAAALGEGETPAGCRLGHWRRFWKFWRKTSEKNEKNACNMEATMLY